MPLIRPGNEYGSSSGLNIVSLVLVFKTKKSSDNRFSLVAKRLNKRCITSLLWQYSFCPLCYISNFRPSHLAKIFARKFYKNYLQRFLESIVFTVIGAKHFHIDLFPVNKDFVSSWHLLKYPVRY